MVGGLPVRLNIWISMFNKMFNNFYMDRPILMKFAVTVKLIAENWYSSCFRFLGRQHQPEKITSATKQGHNAIKHLRVILCDYHITIYVIS